jgi:hypothetical protein
VCAGLFALALAVFPLAAEERQPSDEFKRDKAELDEMLSKRDLAMFEVSFEPLAMNRVLMVDRAGNPHVFQYLAYRVRNQMASDLGGSAPISQAKGYNEVLAEVAKQHEEAKITTNNGVALTVAGPEGAENVIVERQDAQAGTRALRLSFLAHDELGTRIKLLDGTDMGTPAGQFDFPDLGDPTRASVLNVVREQAEEAVGKRLLTTQEVLATKLPPFDAAKRTEEGWCTGELYGVAVFNVLSDYGRKWTIEVSGLTNKMRIHWPETERGKVESYIDAKFLRRVQVLRYDHLGDEYFRDRDQFVLTSSSWEWLPTFQRQDKRRAMAYGRFYLANVVTDKGDRVNPEVAKAFWTYYDEQRALSPTLPDIGKDVKGP